MHQESCENRLDEVVADYLSADPAHRTTVRENLLRKHPELAADLLAFIADHDLMQQVAAPVRQLLSGGHATGGKTPSPVPGLHVGRYELLEELGRGGMGVVFKARDAQLNRVVALKMILTGPWASATEIRRLRAEAEAVAALDHPHIVPLYEVGDHQGQPYFTMKLIEGSTPGAGTKWDGRDAARLVATLALAVQHAHERGILHRDLKPANVLLDRQGEPHLTDFGLARRLGGGALTQTGVIVGTPAYIAPEQASGRAGAVTTAADVYGLGAILYELLTGGPPFRGATSLDVLRQLLETEPARPRSLNPQVAPDLETICLKCLEKDPARRYGGALELAADLNAFRAGEPIHTRPVSSFERLVRWCRRKPLIAGLILALAVSLAGGFAATVVQWQRAERNFQLSEEHRVAAEQNLAEVARERAREEESFHQAHRAVTDFGGLLADELAPIPGLQPLRKKTLELTRSYLENFLRRQQQMPSVRRELAEARLRLAEVMGELEDGGAAAAEAKKALALLDEAQRSDPDNPTVRRQQASAHQVIALLKAQQGRSAEALAGYRRAAELYQDALRLRPGDADARAGLALAANNLGALYQSKGEVGQALRQWERSRTLYGRLHDEQPRQIRFRMGLALALHNLGVLHADRGRTDEARKASARSCELQRELVNSYPQSLDFRSGLATELHHLSMILGSLGQADEARRASQEALELRGRLARENPHVVAFAVALAASLMDNAEVSVQAGRRQDALDSLQRASAILKEQVRRDPGRVQTQLDLGRSYFRTALELANIRQRCAAIAIYLRGRDVLARLVETSPALLDGREELGRTLNNVGLLLGEVGQHEEGRRAIQAGIDQGQHLLKAAPQVVRYRKQLGIQFAALAKVERQAGRLDAAVDSLLARRRLFAGDAQELVFTASELAKTASAVGGGRADLSAQERARRQRYVDLASDTLRQGLAAGYKDVNRLRKAPSLLILRRQPGFEELLRRYEQSR